MIMGHSSGWLEIYFKGISDPLRCSPGHNMLDEEFNQVPASELSEGDSAWYLTSSGTIGLTEIEEIVLSCPSPVEVMGLCELNPIKVPSLDKEKNILL